MCVIGSHNLFDNKDRKAVIAAGSFRKLKMMNLKQQNINVLLVTTLEKQENYGTVVQFVNLGA